jgi:hypothetical protein
MTKLTLTLALLTISTMVIAQLPNTNIYVFSMQREGQQFYFNQPKYLTKFNSKGYNNQPYFVNNNELYMTAQLATDTTQTDIYALNLLTKTRTRLTATPESEYSPMLTPDRNYFSCVRVDAANTDIQRLWKYPVDRSNSGKPVFKSVSDVGYYQWVNDTLVSMYLVGNPDFMVLGKTGSQSIVRVIPKIGRCFQVRPDGRIAYVQKATENTWLLRALNTNTLGSENITPTVPGCEDFVSLPDGTLIMGNGSKLYRFTPGLDKEWVEVADLRYYKINNIKRLAINRNNDKIAIVNEQ